MENTLKIKVFIKSILFCKYLRNGSSDLNEILCGGQLLSCELKVQVSWRSGLKCACTSYKREDSNWSPCKILWKSELPLRRYLQNNVDFLNTLIFIVFSIFSQFHTSKVFQSGKLLNGDRIFWKLDIKMSQSNEEKDICPSSYVAS